MRAPCVLRDALLRSAPQDEKDLYVVLKAYLILRRLEAAVSKDAPEPG
jgi:hypothetical protein